MRLTDGARASNSFLAEIGSIALLGRVIDDAFVYPEDKDLAGATHLSVNLVLGKH